ncbi:hypothetical protein J7J47_16630 [Halomonas sp. ISL-60]|uniref:hypothetical protein n=1 Tax=Halomonas sp. ISL-56 TaxID=2819149 RepID=UPI001BEC1BAA|nr:hypothetical protein [Halomonas sp. ISL-56]MBT2773850.1 hypothetical protein [Halomonas sp. ISL-60]MBT2800892.1 hypothetical protein [Halomonas sp. ISL-56]
MKGVVSRLVVGTPLGSYSALVLAGLAIACLLCLSTSAMAQPIEREYWVNIHTEGAAWVLRINDLNVQSHSFIEQYSISYPISTSLKEGQNTVSFIFAPLIEDDTGYLAKDEQTGEYAQAPKEDFWVDISIEAINKRTQEKERINTLQLRYDMEEGELVASPQTPVNMSGETVHQTEHLRTRGEFVVSSPSQLLSTSGQSVEAERVDMSFRVLDSIPNFHWVDDATRLEDTPRLRHELRQAYQSLYRLFEEGDSDLILREGEAMWDRAGLLVAGGKNAREYISSLPVGSQLVGLSDEPSGLQLLPLMLADDPADDSLEFMGDGRLVRILPTPIRWSYSDDSERSHKLPVVFYRTASGEWRLATVAS